MRSVTHRAIGVGVSETGLLPSVDVRPGEISTPIVERMETWGADLTAKELAFVDHYYRMRNATQAYTAAYDTNGAYETRRDAGYKVLHRPHVAKALAERIKLGTQASVADVGWLLKHFMAIAMADPRELIGMRIGCCRYCYGEGHQYQWREREYVERLAEVEREGRLYPDRAPQLLLPDYAGGFGFNATWPPVPNCPQCHGEGLERFVPRDSDNFSDSAVLLFGGVKVKKDGYEIITADRQKAAELAGRILGAFTDKVKISGAIAHMHAVADLRAVDPQQAAKVYQDFVRGYLT